VVSPLLWRDKPVLHSRLDSGQTWRPGVRIQPILNNQTIQRERINEYVGKGYGWLTSSTLHAATWLAWMPWTPGSSWQCCSQHRDRVLSDWLLRADMNSDGYTPSEDMSEDKHTHTHKDMLIYDHMDIYFRLKLPTRRFTGRHHYIVPSFTEQCLWLSGIFVRFI